MRDDGRRFRIIFDWILIGLAEKREAYELLCEWRIVHSAGAANARLFRGVVAGRDLGLVDLGG